MSAIDPQDEPRDAPQVEAPAETQAVAPKRAWRGRPLLLGVVVGLLGGLLAAAAVIFVAGSQRTPRLTRADYEQAAKRWEDMGPASYDLDVELGGRRAGLVHVEVRDGEVTRMTRDGHLPMQKRTWYYWSVPGQFDMIEEELDMKERPPVSFGTAGAAKVELWGEFDPKYGYPLRFDRVALGTDNEVHWKDTRFEPLDEKK
jgi:hypothetical protein